MGRMFLKSDLPDNYFDVHVAYVHQGQRRQLPLSEFAEKLTLKGMKVVKSDKVI